MSYVKGSLSSSEITGLKPDVSSELSLLDVNRYPLVALLTNFGKDPVLGTGKSMKKESCGNHKFETPFELVKKLFKLLERLSISWYRDVIIQECSQSAAKL